MSPPDVFYRVRKRYQKAQGVEACSVRVILWSRLAQPRLQTSTAYHCCWSLIVTSWHTSVLAPKSAAVFANVQLGRKQPSFGWARG